MRTLPSSVLALAACAALSFPGPSAQDAAPESRFHAEHFAGLKFRELGPAWASGRIADLAIHPDDENIWYVAVGSGGVWKTVNGGTTFEPIFDDQTSYSIGCIGLDPSNPHRVWVGTGENVGGRHVGFGDGIYRSDDGGTTWQHAGLAASEHISEIVVHPHNPDTVLVAVQGPLWTPGGERGVYLTTDGGATWTRTLGDNTWVGATDLAVDPRNPRRVYAATWQRHRTVAAYFGSGPGSGLHRSEDGGRTWTKLTVGLPEHDMGKIGLAISPQQPDVLYAAIEGPRRTGAIYRSTDRGASWQKGADAVAGGTGPHYYQELYASPHAFDRIYLADVRIQVSDDGGRTVRTLKETHKHSDNHAMAFKASDPDYLLVGCDGGVYESLDLAETWRFFANLPLTQFYKVAVDDAEPFYNVFGGTQDNGTHYGPVRTDSVGGIANGDWRMVLDWDGHQPATEPGNPAIAYAERQEGALSRVDLLTGEATHIQPQAAPGEPVERFNWDAPILVSPHDPARIYFASQRVWRSDDRGDAWRAVSGDLTRDLRRIEEPIAGGVQGWEGSWDLYAMSQYSTITSLAESPKQEGLLYAGTDDGLLSVSENGGESWRTFPVQSLPGVPERAFVNDVRADLFDADTVYACLDHHKSGVFRPFVYRSRDRGQTWESIAANLPERTLVWRLVQDHVDPALLFLGTEFGVYFSHDAGGHWTQLQGGMPTISIRDLTIQRREDDLVCASFGRGLFVLDDLSALRNLDDDVLAAEGTLFAPRDAWWYVERPKYSFYSPKGYLGANHYHAANPPFGAVFTYHVADAWKTLEDARKEGDDASLPSWEALDAEAREQAPKVWLIVSDAKGHVVRRLEGPADAGFHRVAWDLRYALDEALDLEAPADTPDWEVHRGLLVAPGDYTVYLALEVRGAILPLGDPQSFAVKPLREGALPGADNDTRLAFTQRHRAAIRLHTALKTMLGTEQQRIARMATALSRATAPPSALDADLATLRNAARDLDMALNGAPAKNQVGVKQLSLVNDQLFNLQLALRDTTRGPTPRHFADLETIEARLATMRERAEALRAARITLGEQLVEAGAPWVEGQTLPPARRR